MLINRLQRTPTGLRLETLHPAVLKSLAALRALLLVLGALALLVWLFGMRIGLPIPNETLFSVMMGGFVLIFLGQFVHWLAGMIRPFERTVVLDRSEQMLSIQTKTPEDYPFLPTSWPFFQLKALRLHRVETAQRKPLWLFELLQSDDRFYPLTLFVQEHKLRATAEAFQTLLDLPVYEESLYNYTFQSYKANFLKQFQPEEHS